METKTKLQIAEFLKLGSGVTIDAYLIPFNEQRELGYMTSHKGTGEALVKGARTLAKNIEAALPGAEVKVHIEDRQSLETICQIGSEKIFDEDGKELMAVEDFLAQVAAERVAA